MPDSNTDEPQHWLLTTLERLLAIEALDPKSTLDQASDLVAHALSADKVDVFLYDPRINSLVAMGTSHTPMGKLQQELGLERLPLSNGGRGAWVFTNKQPFISGRLDQDPGELPGIKEALGVRSVMGMPLYVAGELRGVLQVDSERPDAFNEYDLRFLEAVATWVGMVTHRAELVQRMKRDAQEEARSMVAEELVTIIAHDLGNYITPLMGRLELIRRRAERDGREKDLQDINAMSLAMSHLSALITNLMDAGRLDQGIFGLELQPVELVELANQTADALSSPQCPIQTLSVKPVHVEADPARIRQALENLLSNAVKHSPQGATVILEIDTEKRQDGEWAMLTVKDQGPGISAELLPRLFTRFARGAGSTGLGLGLYLARGIAQAHHGTLTADNVPGGGAAFRLSLPLTQSQNVDRDREV